MLVSIVGTSVAANAVSANVMAGHQEEILKRPSFIEFGLVGSAAGLLATVMIGSQVIIQDQEITGANRYPIVPDDFIVKGAGRAGDKLYITYRNKTGGALTAWTILNITPLA